MTILNMFSQEVNNSSPQEDTYIHQCAYDECKKFGFFCIKDQYGEKWLCNTHKEAKSARKDA
jgi:hypothetical protein